MTDTAVPAEQAVETVVRSFTQAELALTEIAGAIEGFRSASDQLRGAGEREDAATSAMGAAAEASERVARHLESVVAALADVAAALRAVDPDRLWAHLGRMETKQDAIDVRVREDLSRLDGRSVLILRVAIGAAAAGLVAVGLLALAALRVIPLA